MKTTTHSNIILNEDETLLLLKDFCYEALHFLKISKDQYPKIVEGIVFEPNGNVNPLFINYQRAKIIVNIFIFRMMYISRTHHDSPSMYRLMGYQLARFWYRHITYRNEDLFDAMDKDSLVFACSLMVLKGCRINPLTPITDVIAMLKSEFNIECEHRMVMDMQYKIRQDIIRPTAEEHIRIFERSDKLKYENINRELACIEDGAVGSKTNPFGNVDEAADYIQKIEKERLATDAYRQEILKEEYFYDGYTFRIPWSSGNVSYYPIDGTPENFFVVNQLSTHNKFVLKPSLVNHKFLYRGQSQFYSPCKPSMFRMKKDYYVDDIIQINELECLLRTHPLVKLFEQGFELFHDTFHFKINYIGLSQHYYNNTSLLDLTSDIDVAKFFAVTTFNMKSDRYEKYSGDQLGVLYYFDLKADTFQQSKNRNYIVDNIGKQPFMRSGNQSGYLVQMSKDDDFNNYPDVRYVFFRHDEAITDRIFKQFDNGEKIMPEEILRSHWHNRKNDDEKRMLISTSALKLNYSINPHESHAKILKALQKKGFKIKSYSPSFTEEELILYYDTALESWDEFCSNIYFYSPEGALMKEHLRNLPNDPRYRWAFVR